MRQPIMMRQQGAPKAVKAGPLSPVRRALVR